MRTAVTLAKTHKGSWVMLANPDVPLQKQNEIYRSFLLEKAHPDYCYVQLQESDGLFKRVHLRTPDQHKEHVATLDKQNQEAREAGERELKDRETVAKKNAQARADQHQAELDALNEAAAKLNTKPAKPEKGMEVAPETPAAPATPAAEGSNKDLKTGGPTIEDWTEQGYNPLAYPPEGFAEVDSPGLQEFKATGKVTPRVAPAAPAATETPAAEVAAPAAQAPVAADAAPVAPIESQPAKLPQLRR